MGLINKNSEAGLKTFQQEWGIPVMKNTRLCCFTFVSLTVLLLSATTDVCDAASQVISRGYYWIGRGGVFSPVTPPPVVPTAIAVAGGAGHSLALLEDGTVVGWGDNTFGQRMVPAQLNGVVAIAAGDYHSLALRADGSVVAWGDNSGGQTKVPLDLTNAVAICAGDLHSVALRADGTVTAWGDNGVGQTNVPYGLKNIIAISSANVHSLALIADGTVVAWGNNYYGECNVPADLTNAVAIAAGGEHNVALTADGRIVCWGDNSFGEASAPSNWTNVIEVAAGGVHSLALQQDGSVILWGAGTTVNLTTGGDYGQSVVPAGLTNVAEIAAGYIHSLYLLRSGPPVMTGPMLSRTVVAGSTSRFWASASGAQPLSFQWQLNGTNLTGVNGALLELPNIQTNQSGQYSVVVANTFGSITSSVMQIAVAPLLIAGPKSQLAIAGDTVTFAVSPTGVNPFSYQWYFDGLTVPGATNSSLVMSNVQAANAGTYSVSVKNPIGTVMSANATLALTQVAVWGGCFPETLTNLPVNLGNVVALSGGLYHTLALRDDGTVVAWGGDNYYGEWNVPSNLTNVTAVSAGCRFSLALKGDGTVVGWGWNGFQQLSIPSSLRNVVAIAAGDTHSLALRTNGSVVAWGSPAVVPANLSNVVAIAAARDYSMALRADGTVTAWSMGDGSSLYVPAGVSNVIAIAAGRDHTLALRADGMVVAWSIENLSLVDVPPDLTNAVAIASGEYHSLALRPDGTVEAWGANGLGQATVPSGLTNVSAIAAGFQHSLALVQAGAPVLRSEPINTVVVYGANTFLHVAAVGAGPLTYQWQCNGTNIPNATKSTLQIASVGSSDTGLYSVVVSNRYGSVTSSGATLGVVPFIITQYPSNQYTFRGGSVSLAVAVTSQLPMSYQWQFDGTNLPGATGPVLAFTNAQLNQAGQYCVVVSNALATEASANATVEIGQVVAWGDNSFNQLELPRGLTNIVAVAGGEFHSLALRADGTVVGWGSIGTPFGMTNITAIAAGFNYDLGLTVNGSLIIWGSNSIAQSGLPAGLSDVVAISAGESFCLALRANGQVVAWGYNYYHQTDVPAGLTNVVAIAAGGDFSLALRTNGTIVAWGDDGWGECDVPPGLTNVVAIAAGFDHSLALRADGTMVVWGANYDGQTNMPSGITNVIAILAGGNHSLAMRGDRTVISWGDFFIGQMTPPSYATNLVMVSAGAAHNVAILDSLWPLVVPASSSGQTKNSDQDYSKHRGSSKSFIQATQHLLVFNRSPFIYPAVRVHIRDLPPLTSVLNASGLDQSGCPFVQSSGMLAPGASVNLDVCYLTPDGRAPNVTIAGDVVVPQAVSRCARLQNGDFLMEFNDLNNGNYYIEYSEDLLNWRTAYHGTPSNGALVQWVDSGPPYSESAPAVQSQRFYRVFLTP
jgi:alpha-tubulin suppressor-like RCC1 family protein